MSLQFNDTSTGKGIVQIYEKECGFPSGYVSGNTQRLKDFTADVNLAMDDFQNIAVRYTNTWQSSDSNHTKYSIMFMNLASGVRDYAFTTDEQDNLITNIYRVAVANSSGVYSEIYPVDQQLPNLNNRNTDSFINGQNATGTPTRYDKTDNALFLDPVPNYSYTNGIKFLADRESSYFVYTDTTKKPGVYGQLHRYFALKPALDEARRNGLETYDKLYTEILKYEGDESRGLLGWIALAYANREKDVAKRIIPNVEDTK